jgi:hypothetical protein
MLLNPAPVLPSLTVIFPSSSLTASPLVARGTIKLEFHDVDCRHAYLNTNQQSRRLRQQFLHKNSTQAPVDRGNLQERLIIMLDSKWQLNPNAN